MAMNRRRFLQAAGVGAGLGMTGAAWAFHEHGALMQPSYGEISNLEILGYSNMQFRNFAGNWDQTYEFRVSANGRHAYTSHQIGFCIVDVSDPTNMRVIARRENETGQRTQYIDLVGSLLVVKETTRISLWDVSKPHNPTRVGFYQPPDVTGGFHGLWVHKDQQGTFAFAACQVQNFRQDILLIIDITNPASPTEVARWWYPGQGPGETVTWPDGITVRAHDFTTYKDRAYLAWRDKGLIILDISNIRRPSVRGEINWSDGRPGMFSLPGQTHSVGIVIPEHGGRPDTVIVPDELTRAVHCPWGFMHIIDVRDDTRPREISGYKNPLNMEGNCPPDRPGVRFGTHDVERMIRGSIVWSAWEEAGFWGIDISDIHRPKSVAYYVPPVRSDSPTFSGHADDVFVHANGVIFGSSSDEGGGGLWAMAHKPGFKGTVVWNADNSGVIVSPDSRG